MERTLDDLEFSDDPADQIRFLVLQQYLAEKRGSCPVTMRYRGIKAALHFDELIDRDIPKSEAIKQTVDAFNFSEDYVRKMRGKYATSNR